MTSMTVQFFDDPELAARASHLIEGDTTQTPTLLDAAIVTWQPDDRRPEAWQVPLWGSQQTLSGAFWGMLFAHLFLIPLSHDESGSPRHRPPDRSLDHLGLPECRLAEIRSHVRPGRSALFVLHEHGPAEPWMSTTPAIHVIRFRPVEARRLYAGFGHQQPDA